MKNPATYCVMCGRPLDPTWVKGCGYCEPRERTTTNDLARYSSTELRAELHRRRGQPEATMSTSYTAVPPIDYDAFLARTGMPVEDPPRRPFVSDSKALHLGGAYLHVRRAEDGSVEFVRFGRNRVAPILARVIEEFGVKIRDEYGLVFPDCLG